MVRLPSLIIGTPRLSRTLAPRENHIGGDRYYSVESPIITIEDIHVDVGLSDMESPVKQRVKSAKKRENSRDSLCGDVIRKDTESKPSDTRPDNRPKSSLRRAQSSKGQRAQSPGKPTGSARQRSEDKENEETAYSLSFEENQMVKKNVNSLFGAKAKKSEGDKEEKGPKDDSPWGEFEDYIRNIDLDTMHFQTKPFTETSSGDFKTVMTGMKTEVTDRKSRRAGFKNTLKMSIKFQGFKKSMAELKEAVQKQEELDAKKKLKTAKKTPPGPKSRGWKILRNYLQEMHLEKQKTMNMGGWNFLTKTMKSLSNQEQARQDLYERYLYKPNAWTEGFSTLPPILQDRMKARDNPGGSPHIVKRERPHTAVGVIRGKRRSGGAPANQSINNTRITTSNTALGDKGGNSRKVLNRRPHSSVAY